MQILWEIQDVLQLSQHAPSCVALPMKSFLTRLMYENTLELKRLIREGNEAAKDGNQILLRLKMAGLKHAMDVGARLVQIQRLWDDAGHVNIRL